MVLFGLAVAVTAGSAAVAAALPAEPFFVGYFASWADRADADGGTQLGRVAGFVTIVDIAFMRPDAVYRDGYALDGTGLDFAYPGHTLLAAIAQLRRRHPQTRIMLAVGGSAYTAWNRLDADAIRRFVQDFGLDGVDIDEEVAAPGCAARADGDIACASDAGIIATVEALRRALPRPLLLSMSVPHVGAYDPARWPREIIPGSRYTGMFRQVLQAPAVRGAIDFINLMAYDAGNGFHPLAAAAAYREIYPGPIAIGVEPAPEGSGDHVYTLAEVSALAAAVRRQHLAGMMLYNLQKPPAAGGSAPDARAIAAEICAGLELGGCDAPLY